VICHRNHLFGYLLFQRCRSRHHVFVRIQFPYGNHLGTQYALVKAYGFNMHRILELWWIGPRLTQERCYAFVWLCFLQTQPQLTTSWSRSHLWLLWLSADNIKHLHKLSKCCQWWCGCSCVCLGFHNCWNLQFGHPILHISLTQVVRCIPPVRLCLLVKHHLPLPKTLHAVLDHFGGSAHLLWGCLIAVINTTFCKIKYSRLSKKLFLSTSYPKTLPLDLLHEQTNSLFPQN